MADRLRAFLDRSLDPSAARAIVALASAILLGFAALFAFGGGEPGPASSGQDRPPAAPSPAPVAPREEVGDKASVRRQPTRRQDPQDIEGSAAARRANRALRSHRALQHVPYRDGGMRITLVGARGSKAVLRVSAPTVAAARRGWRRFLRRFRDSGRAYAPVFRASGGARSGSGA